MVREGVIHGLGQLESEGGDKGGTIVAEGVPEDVAKTKGSFTGEYLKGMLKAKP
jgi:excinuclease ABC subunit A